MPPRVTATAVGQRGAQKPLKGPDVPSRLELQKRFAIADGGIRLRGSVQRVNRINLGNEQNIARPDVLTHHRTLNSGTAMATP